MADKTMTEARTNLIADLEAATEGSRELDARILASLCHVRDILIAPYYTISIDEVRCLTNWVLLHAGEITADGLALVRYGNPATSEEVVGIHSKLEMAWCIASLRAMEKETSDE